MDKIPSVGGGGSSSKRKKTRLQSECKGAKYTINKLKEEIFLFEVAASEQGRQHLREKNNTLNEMREN